MLSYLDLLEVQSHLNFSPCFSLLQERLAGVYQELGSEECEPVLFSVLIEHPIIQDIVSTLSTYKSIVSKTWTPLTIVFLS